MTNNRQKSKLANAISLGLEMGFLIAIPLVLLLFLGAYLDKRFSTTPIFIMIFLVLSFIVTILEARFLILPFLEKRSQRKN